MGEKPMTPQPARALIGASGITALSEGTAPAQRMSGNDVGIDAVVDMTGVHSANGGKGAALCTEMARYDAQS